MLVLLGIIVILLSIFVPSLMRLRENNNRKLCEAHLREIGTAMMFYARDNRGTFPRAAYDQENHPTGYTAYTGPDSPTLFGPDSRVEPNDVTASLWLLIRQGYLAKVPSAAAKVFICPSSADDADPITDAAGRAVPPTQRSNFRKASNLSYSYAIPFSNAAGYGPKWDFMPSEFVILADKNPGVDGRNANVTAPPWNAPPLQLAQANSRNHWRAGQSVLYADMHAAWRSTPYCGVDHDNIYTALALTPIFTGIAPDMKSNGYCGRQLERRLANRQLSGAHRSRRAAVGWHAGHGRSILPAWDHHRCLSVRCFS